MISLTKITHIFTAIACTIPVIHNHPMSAIGLIGSTLPDIDYKIGIEHRTITHSLIFMIFTTLLISYINSYIGLVFGISIASHLVLDSFTKTGIPLFYPSKKYYGRRTVKTGTNEENFCILISSIMIIVYAVLMK